MVDKLIAAIAISLVPYKSPCWCLASFTPDVMQSVIRTPIAPRHRYKRNYLFLTSLYLHYEASLAGSHNSTHQQLSSEIESPFFLIVHHIACFHRCSIRWFASSLWQAPAEGHLFSLNDPAIGQFSSLDLRMISDLIRKVFHLLYSILTLTTEWSSRHTRLCLCSAGNRRAKKCSAAKCLARPSPNCQPLPN